MAAAKGAVIAVGGAPYVNLMPSSETERRHAAVLIRRWLVALITAMLFVVAATAGSYSMQFIAAQRLAAENERTETLLSQLADLSDVQSQLDLQSELATFRADAMATDLRWGGLLGAVGGALPDDVLVTGFSLAPAGVPQGDDPSAEVGAAGSVTLASAGPQQMVPLVRAVRAVPGVLEVDGWVLEATETGFTYELRIVFDQSVYTGDYAEAEEAE